MMSNCDNCIFRGQWCEKENKCPLFKEDPESEEEPEEKGMKKTFCDMCGKQTTYCKSFVIVTDNDNQTKTAYDVCKDCIKRIEKFMAEWQTLQKIFNFD